jgi:phosphatidate cytidylyltransferase
MTDDEWRDRSSDDDFNEFGSLFDDAEPTQNIPEVPIAEDEGLSFGDGNTGSLPHWTEPPTGEIPRFDTDEAGVPAADEELDVWSSFSSEAPVWQDDAPPEPEPEPGTERRTGRQSRVTGQTSRVTSESEAVPREPSRITIGTDPSGMPRRDVSTPPRRRGGPPPAGSRPRPRPGPVPVPSRSMPTAIAVGTLIFAVFLAATMYRPVAVAILVVVILGLAAVELYDKTAEKGYRPAVVPGIIACVAAPIAAYWVGDGSLPLTISFAFMATAASFAGARNVESGPMPNVSITTLGIVWIGLLGSFAMLILRFSTQAEVDSLAAIAENRGTDTIFLLALGVIANDTGALIVGSAVGRTPLRSWISPNKTVEGFIGGTLFTVIAMMLVKISEKSETWTSFGDLLALAVVIAIMAPMGDLVESMFKRNLDIKDFGSLIKGHGGILDRFDGFLFTLPAVYYLTLVLQPWSV